MLVETARSPEKGIADQTARPTARPTADQTAERAEVASTEVASTEAVLPGLPAVRAADLDRLTAYSYLSAPDRATYLAIMRVFVSTLLADLSAQEVSERLAEQGVHLAADVIADKLDNLKDWGDLLPSSRPVRAASIREYHRARSRYQLSALGERIQRQADEIIASADAAREVSRELLALVARGLTELGERSSQPGGLEAHDALARISSLFAQFGQFAESVRDFYAYLGQVIFRYDLDTTEFTGFKELLLDYAETITEEVAFFAPQIEAGLSRLWPSLPTILARIDAADTGLSALQEADIRLQRSRGRELADWEGLRAWFVDPGGEGSQVDQLRDATLRALQALLANAKRMIRSRAGELSRRKDLLRLAAWFDAADEPEAHDLYVAAFGLYPARHLGLTNDRERDAPASTSWWHGSAVPVPISLVERGSRAARGRIAAAEDYAAAREALRRHAEEDVRRQRAAAAELRAAAARLADARLSAAATKLLLELLARSLAGAPAAFARADTWDEDLDLELTLRRTPGRHTVIHGVEGDLTLDELAIGIQAATGRPVHRAHPDQTRAEEVG